MGSSAINSALTPLTLNGVSKYSSDMQAILNRAVQIAQIPITFLQNHDSDDASAGVAAQRDRDRCFQFWRQPDGLGDRGPKPGIERDQFQHQRGDGDRDRRYIAGDLHHRFCDVGGHSGIRANQCFFWGFQFHACIVHRDAQPGGGQQQLQIHARQQFAGRIAGSDQFAGRGCECVHSNHFEAATICQFPPTPPARPRCSCLTTLTEPIRIC